MASILYPFTPPAMDANVYTYEGNDVTVTWDRERCIHAEIGFAAS